MQAKDTPLPGPPQESAPAVEPKTCITICLGSSCFTRGNDEHLPLIQDWLAQRGQAGRVALKGSRCEGQCQHGPNLKIADQLVHHVQAGDLEDILERAL